VRDTTRPRAFGFEVVALEVDRVVAALEPELELDDALEVCVVACDDC
jgi:hypothetical protein